MDEKYEKVWYVRNVFRALLYYVNKTGTDRPTASTAALHIITKFFKIQKKVLSAPVHLTMLTKHKTEHLFVITCSFSLYNAQDTHMRVFYHYFYFSCVVWMIRAMIMRNLLLSSLILSLL